MELHFSFLLYCDSVLNQNSLSTLCKLFYYLYPCSLNPAEVNSRGKSGEEGE